MTVPAPDAPFSEKMAYHRTQHRSRGVRIAHMIGTPVILAGMPLLAVKPPGGSGDVRRRLALADRRA
jgi:hypothetical protein